MKSIAGLIFIILGLSLVNAGSTALNGACRSTDDCSGSSAGLCCGNYGWDPAVEVETVETTTDTSTATVTTTYVGVCLDDSTLADMNTLAGDTGSYNINCSGSVFLTAIASMFVTLLAFF